MMTWITSFSEDIEPFRSTRLVSRILTCMMSPLLPGGFRREPAVLLLVSLFSTRVTVSGMRCFPFPSIRFCLPAGKWRFLPSPAGQAGVPRAEFSTPWSLRPGRRRWGRERGRKGDCLRERQHERKQRKGREGGASRCPFASCLGRGELLPSRGAGRREPGLPHRQAVSLVARTTAPVSAVAGARVWLEQ